jgi:hypothetical protein
MIIKFPYRKDRKIYLNEVGLQRHHNLHSMPYQILEVIEHYTYKLQMEDSKEAYVEWEELAGYKAPPNSPISSW